MKNKIYTFVLTAFAAAAVPSCGFLDLEPEVITADTYYNSRTEVLNGLAGVYGVINNEAFYGNYYSLMLSNCDDLCYYNRPTTSNYSPWYRHDASTQEVYEAWTEIYQGIGNANSFLEAVADSEYDPDHVYYNEARFLRAYYYFVLAQAWGDVPLRTTAATSPSEVSCPATPQLQVLQWVVSEMEATIDLLPESLENAPSRVVRTTAWGILARVYLFMAGETVSGNEAYRHDYYGKAMENAKNVIDSGRHSLNPSYSQIFINMISDEYDTRYYESMWEADFLGNRSSSESWSNGRIGDLIGLQSSPSVGTYDQVSCNFAYGQYNGSLKLWNLYWHNDRTEDETDLETVTDVRQEWNMCPYNYAGGNFAPYGETSGTCVAGIDKTPYRHNSISTTVNPVTAKAIRNCGKYRREVIYEGVKGDRGTYTPVNYPILRYSDVLLMYAEAYNEYNGAPSQEAYDCVKAVRDRAGIATRDFSEYSSAEAFRSLVRNERGRELVFESLRKYDLIRWGVFLESMRDYLTDTQNPEWVGTTAGVAASTASSVQARHIVLPIPTIELGVNGELEQNPLW